MIAWPAELWARIKARNVLFSPDSWRGTGKWGHAKWSTPMSLRHPFGKEASDITHLRELIKLPIAWRAGLSLNSPNPNRHALRSMFRTKIYVFCSIRGKYRRSRFRHTIPNLSGQCPRDPESIYRSDRLRYTHRAACCHKLRTRLELTGWTSKSVNRSIPFVETDANSRSKNSDLE